MKSIFYISFVAFSAFCVSSCSSTKELELNKKIKELESRVAKLEAANRLVHNKMPKAKVVKLQPVVKLQRAKALKRIKEDRTYYSKEDLIKIEKLYQEASKAFSEPKNLDELKKRFQKIVNEYPKSNRAGCSLMYLAQLSIGKEREDYLKKAIKSFGNCWYKDGVHIASYARIFLAFYALRLGEKDKAKKIFDEIIKDYPNSISHRGKLHRDQILRIRKYYLKNNKNE